MTVTVAPAVVSADKSIAAPVKFSCSPQSSHVIMVSRLPPAPFEMTVFEKKKLAFSISLKLMPEPFPLVSNSNEFWVNEVVSSMVNVWPHSVNSVPFAGTVMPDAGKVTCTVAFEPTTSKTSAVSGWIVHASRFDTGSGIG